MEVHGPAIVILESSPPTLNLTPDCAAISGDALSGTRALNELAIFAPTNTVSHITSPTALATASHIYSNLQAFKDTRKEQFDVYRTSSPLVIMEDHGMYISPFHYPGIICVHDHICK